MELKDFIKKVISDSVEAVDETSKISSRKVTLASRADRRTIEFDVAVSAEEKTTTDGKAGVRVLNFIEAGADIGSESKNSTVSRITFGVDVDTSTKEEKARQKAELDAYYNSNRERGNDCI